MMIIRVAFAAALALGLLAAPLAVDAQPEKKTARVGYLSSRDRLSRGWQAEVLKAALRGHGWIEGENLMIEYRFGGERYERLRTLADDLVRLKVDLIFASSAPSRPGSERR